MRKLAKKVLAICLSAVMAGTMLSAVAFATESEAVSDDEYDEYGIATLASSTVIKKDETKTDWSVSGDVYIEKDVTLTLEGTTTISGNVYVFGTLRNNGSLTVSGTLHCLHYNNSMSASGNYDYGYFLNYGSAKVTTLDVTSKWLDTEIPDTGDDDDDNDGDDSNDEPDTDGGAFSGQHVTVISGDEEKDDWVTSGVVYIPKDASLTTTGDVTINGDVYVVGTLTNTGTFTVTGTIYCLHYNSSLSAGDYDYGYVYNRSSMSAHAMVVKDNFLSIDFPTATVHTWDSGEVIVEHTCTEPGEMLYTCTVCGATMTEEIPAEHTWGEVEWTWNEDHTSATATRTCLVCGETETVDAEITEETVETEDGETETVITAAADFGDEEDGEADVAMESVVESNEDEDEGNTTTGTGTTGTGSTGTGSSGNSGTSGSSGTGSTVTSPQTDDFANTTALWLIVACFGVAGCVALVAYKVRGTKEQD